MGFAVFDFVGNGAAYVAYERIGRLWPGVEKASCWVHARRKFEECHKVAATQKTHTALAYFRQLFDLEDQSRESADDERLAWRQAKMKPIVDSFVQWLQQECSQQLPKAKLLAAINYMLNRWDSFTRFLEAGNVPMDSNSAERAVKFPILGRNYAEFLIMRSSERRFLNYRYSLESCSA